jgi:hypothetical protein
MSHTDLHERHLAVMPSWMPLYYDRPIPIVRGCGHHVTDGEGIAYLDMFGGIVVSLIIKFAGMPAAKVFFVNSGTEVMEAALLFVTAPAGADTFWRCATATTDGRSAGTRSHPFGMERVAAVPFGVSYMHNGHQVRSPLAHVGPVHLNTMCLEDPREVIATVGGDRIAGLGRRSDALLEVSQSRRLVCSACTKASAPTRHPAASRRGPDGVESARPTLLGQLDARDRAEGDRVRQGSGQQLHDLRCRRPRRHHRFCARDVNGDTRRQSGCHDRALGVLISRGVGNVTLICPPPTISAPETREGLAIVAETLTGAAAAQGAVPTEEESHVQGTQIQLRRTVSRAR